MKVFFVLTVCFVVAYGKVTPDYFLQCKRSDPQLEKCVINGIESMRPQLKVGIPEVNIPPLDPFVLPTLKLDRTAPNLRLKATIKNMKTHGALNFRIEKLKINLNNKYAAEIKLAIPKLSVSGEYDVRGSRLLTLDINGKGTMRSTLTGIVVVAKGIGNTITKDGVDYLQVDKVVTKLKVGNGAVELKDTERPVAAESAAAFFNASPNVVLDILNPLIEDTAAVIIKKYINKILGSIPINEVLLPHDA